MTSTDPKSGADLNVDPELLRIAGAGDRQAAELAGLGGAPGADPQLERLPAIPLERELAGMFEMIGAGAGHFLPSVKVVLDESTCMDLGNVIAPVARKWGLDRHLSGFKWRVELQAAFVVIPVGMAIAGAVRHDLDQYKRAAAGGGAPGADPLGAGSGAPASSSSAPAAEKTEVLKPIERPAT